MSPRQHIETKNMFRNTNIENAERYDLYPSKYNFKYFTRLQSACSYQGKLQTNYAVLTFCDFKHRIIVFIITD